MSRVTSLFKVIDGPSVEPQAQPQPVLTWPTPPYACYVDSAPKVPLQACEVEGDSGHRHSCLLSGFNVTGRTALIQLSAGRTPVPVRLGSIRCMALAKALMPLSPLPSATKAGPRHAHDDLLDYRVRLNYRLQLADGTERQGQTIGHVENEVGLFLFHPLDEHDAVQRVLYPREAYRALQIGDRIGQVLVTEKVVTAEQVERAVLEQEVLRNRKLGDYLVMREVVSQEQLLLALEQQSKMPLVRVGDALITLGLVSQENITQALETQKRDRSVPLGEILVRSGQLSRRDLHKALACKMGFPVVNLKGFQLDIKALQKVPNLVARRLNVLPLLLRDNMLVVAAETQLDRTTIEELEFVAQTKVLTALAGEGDLGAMLAKAYSLSGAAPSEPLARDDEPEIAQPAAPDAASRLLESLEKQSQNENEEGPMIEKSDNSLVLLINAMIIDAHKQGASDIHIETFATRRKLRIRFRKDGILVPYMELPHTYRAALVARLKIMCDIDTTERRKAQDGKIDFSRFSSQHKIELRVATIPTQGGAEDIVMRILSSAQPLPLERLGLSADNLKQLREVSERPYGMVLCVGPTGSGKTTTLHSVLQHLNTPQRKIWTAENPIEITNPDLRQVQVNPKIDWGFSDALRSFLRADPDIIMVGEIRDQETAQVAVEASLTGHLILSTLHTNSAPETVTRLLDMGLNPFNFADSLLAVLAQRLVRQLCPACKESAPASDAEVGLLVDEYLSAFPAEDRPLTPEALRTDWQERFGVQGRLQRYRAVGCAHCDHTGYRGRVGLHELLMVDADIRHLIMKGASPDVLRQSAMRRTSFRTLRQDGMEKVLMGQTSMAEVRANCNI